jgi:hypothetical protein
MRKRVYHRGKCIDCGGIFLSCNMHRGRCINCSRRLTPEQIAELTEYSFRINGETYKVSREVYEKGIDAFSARLQAAALTADALRDLAEETTSPGE